MQHPDRERVSSKTARVPPRWQGCHQVPLVTVAASLYETRTNFKVASKVAKTAGGGCGASTPSPKFSRALGSRPQPRFRKDRLKPGLQRRRGHGTTPQTSLESGVADRAGSQ